MFRLGKGTRFCSNKYYHTNYIVKKQNKKEFVQKKLFQEGRCRMLKYTLFSFVTISIHIHYVYFYCNRNQTIASLKHGL